VNRLTVLVAARDEQEWIGTTVERLREAFPDAGVVVADDGPGISRTELPHVFERFHRGREERGTTTGAGLGLSIARELTEMMGGRITAESPAEGGARFTVRLPHTAADRRRRAPV